MTVSENIICQKDLAEHMVDVGVHEALLVPVFGHSQDLRGNRRESRDGDVHVAPGGHGQQRGDLGIKALVGSRL